MFGATVIVPLGFKVKPVGVAVFQVSVTELILGFGTPFNLSLVNTLGVVPPAVLVMVVTPSFTASIVVGVATVGTNTFYSGGSGLHSYQGSNAHRYYTLSRKYLI